jgi:ketosteroid isomerase-like protein
MSAKAEKNEQIVRKMLENGLAGNYDAIRRHIADDYRCHLPAGLPYGGEYRGWDGYTEVFAKIVDFFADVSFGPNEILANDDKVVILSRIKGTVRKSGKSFDMPLVEVWELEGDMVTAVTAFYHDTKLLSELNG